MKLPRFQFSLRTLMIGVTLLAAPCAYVGWQAKIVRERAAMLADHTFMFHISFDDKEIPLCRRWLGDHGQALLVTSDDTSDELLARYRDEFPESVVVRLRDRDEGDNEMWRRHPPQGLFVRAPNKSRVAGAGGAAEAPASGQPGLPFGPAPATQPRIR